MEIPESGQIDKRCTHDSRTELGRKLTSVDSWHEFRDKFENMALQELIKIDWQGLL
jgi:hypothetical protein